jgi:hypothetical protein
MLGIYGLFAVVLIELPYASTERAEYFVTDRKLSVDITHVEKFLVHADKILRTKTPMFRFVRVSDGAEVDLGCFGELSDESVVGRVCGFRAYSIHRDHDRHEVVHLVWTAAFPGSEASIFWQEGFATLIGDRRVNQREARALSYALGTLDDVRRRADRPQWYNASAAFQQWLVKRYGMSKLIDFFWLCATTRENQAFEEAFGIDRAAAELLWRTDE